MINFYNEISQIKTIFIDTAPIIYYIESHSLFGPLIREVVKALQSENLIAFTSVITIAEVLPKPIEAGNEVLAKKFVEFMKYSKNLNLIEISADIAEKAGKLRGKYPNIKTMDAIQISAALHIGTDAFLTNDSKLQKIKEINVMVLKDYL